MPGDFFEFDLVIRSEISIHASAARVWAPLNQIEQWKDSVASVETIAGVPGSVGHTIRVGQIRGENTVFVTQKTLVADLYRWKVEYLKTEAGNGVRGYIVYSLFEDGPSTRLVCELLMQGSTLTDPAGNHTAEQLVELASRSTREKLDSDHRVLKQLIERGDVQSLDDVKELPGVI